MGLFVDYGDVDDISARILLPSLVFSIITPLFVIARFVSQKAYIKRIAADDWVILASLVRRTSLFFIGNKQLTPLKPGCGWRALSDLF